MSNWNEMFNLIQPLNALEKLKANYFKKLTQYTKRNTIVYFSAWQQKNDSTGRFSIEDDDRNGFMNALYKMDASKGLDLILHTPGGDTAATQSIVNYLYNFFNGDIRVIVPLTSMSAGTMIACAAKEIIMAKHSNLGPVDPQINGTPAYEYLKMYKNALNEIKNNSNVVYWTNILSKYPPTFFGYCNNEISSSRTILTTWLERGMLKENKLGVKKTVDYLLDYNTHLLHNNRLDINMLTANTCLKIKLLEEDEKLQEYVLSLYYCYQIMSSTTQISKIIENNSGVKFIKNVTTKL